MKKIIFSLLVLFSIDVFAHVTPYPNVGVVDTYSLVSFNVPDGCKGSETVGITIKSPLVGLKMKPTPKAGWSLTTKTRPLPDEFISHKGSPESYSDENYEMSWSGGSIPDMTTDQFIVHFKNPKAPQLLKFEAEQVCKDGTKVIYTQEDKESTDTIRYNHAGKYEVK